MKVHCLFEQSGTFKNEFKKLGYEAFDYDVLDDFGQTDFKVDLFDEINAIMDGKLEPAIEVTKKAIAEGVQPQEIINNYINPPIKENGQEQKTA